MSKKKKHKPIGEAKNLNSKTYGIFTFNKNDRPPLPKGETISAVEGLFEINFRKSR